MWLAATVTQLMVLCLAVQGETIDNFTLLNSGFNSPANVSARARVQKLLAVPPDANYEIGVWDTKSNITSVSDKKSNKSSAILQDMWSYVSGNCEKSTIFAYSEVEKVAAGIYVGGNLEHTQNIRTLLDDVNEIAEALQSSNSWVWQFCGKSSNYTLGIAVDLRGDLAAVQQHIRTWSDGKCVSGFSSLDTGSISLLSTHTTSLSIANVSAPVAGNNNKTNTVQPRSSSAHALSPSHGHSKHHIHRRSTCSYVQVVSGDSCASLVEECGISASDFYDHNPSSDLCSTLAVGQYVCCSSGNLPDFAPSAYANGTCYTYDVVSGDTCSSLAATYSLTEDEIDSFNSDTWGWYGCDDLQAGQSICLSNGTAPYPVALANAVCGPQVPGTNFTGTTVGDWATLNPCPLNACCDIWGQCGATPDYCNDTLAASGAPGTAPPGSNGCISNCGTTIVNTAITPSSFSAVGYFEATNVERPCLQMNAFTISPEKFTHVHFAFGNITSNFSISVTGAEQQFTYFQELENMKRIISFGGWDFSTSPDTYMIFREGVTAANRDTLVQNVVDFLDKYDLDGVDFDWEYPGEPDIEGIPAGSDEDGSNYLEFLIALREALPSKSISISAPASYWYLKAFPIAEMVEVVDYIVFMTYDLHGTWDLGDEYSQSGCTAGDCLFNHVNLTETMWALSMISKAPAATSSIMVGVASYGRSFEMATAGCYSSSCTWTAGGAPGPCTQTTGYISNAEINQILAENPDAEWIFDDGSDSDIMVYNETQWVGYMTNTTKSTRAAYYQTFNFAGTSEWAIDLEEFEVYVNPDDPGLLDLDVEIDDLGLDVNQNLSCIDLIPGDNTTAELEEYVMLGAAYIDEVLTEYAGNPKDWDENMAGDFAHAHCQDFPTGPCESALGYQCTDGDITSGLYWAQYMVATLFTNLAQWHAAFNDGGTLAGLDIQTIADTFAPNVEGGELSFSTFESALSTAFGLSSTALPGSGVLTDPLDTALTTASTFIGLISSSYTLPDSSDIETELTNMMGHLYNSTILSITDIVTWVYEYPNEASNLPSSLTEGPFTHDVANYFYNVKPLFGYDAITWDNMLNSINSTLKMNLVGAALAAADYYILKDASVKPKKCTGVGDYLIDDICYTLAWPGAADCVQGQAHNTHATKTIIDSITSYGINITEMLVNSEACQNDTGVYYGYKSVDITEVAQTGVLPTCFFNLPVLQLISVDGLAPFWDSPCWINEVNASVTDVTVGISYVPSNLYKIFNQDYCTCGYATVCKRTHGC
ncbi:hypothetical protein AnigIFM60653_007442 [Aspergillus niger]|nr:hypothetical protein AnigIFM60653_007442 [Aspergillus niger]